MSASTSLIHFAEAKAGLGILTNRTLKAACVRHDIPIVALSSRLKGLRPDDYELLLTRASRKETA